MEPVTLDTLQTFLQRLGERSPGAGDFYLLGYLPGWRATSVSVLQRIRQLVIDRRYYLSAHAEEEMWADGLERPDVERCILRGRIEKLKRG